MVIVTMIIILVDQSLANFSTRRSYSPSLGIHLSLAVCQESSPDSVSSLMWLEMARSIIDPVPASATRPVFGSSFGQMCRETHDHGPRQSNQADKSQEVLRLPILPPLMPEAYFGRNMMKHHPRQSGLSANRGTSIEPNRFFLSRTMIRNRRYDQIFELSCRSCIRSDCRWSS